MKDYNSIVAFIENVFIKTLGYLRLYIVSLAKNHNQTELPILN